MRNRDPALVAIRPARAAAEPANTAREASTGRPGRDRPRSASAVSHRRRLGRAALAVFMTAAVACQGEAPGRGSREVNVFIWSGYLPREVVEDFEARTGIAVHVDTYDAAEAVLEKLQSGVASYDLVVPSDYVVRILIAQGLLQPLDRSRLPNFRHLDPRFLDRDSDPGNRFCVPYLWGTTGIGYNRQVVAEGVRSWNALFDERHRGRILMLDDMREVFAVALRTLGRSANETAPAALRRAAALLKRQKPLVKTYNSADFHNILAAGDVDLAHAYNGQLAQVVRRDPGRLAYVVPDEGGTIWMDSVCVPAGAPHPDAAHAFLDFVLEPEIAARVVNGTHYASANLAARRWVEPGILGDPAVYPADEVVARCEYLEDLGDTTPLLDRLWTEIKAR